MTAVLRSVALDDFIFAVVATNRESDLDDVIALLHQRENTLDFRFALSERQAGALYVGEIVDELVLDEHACAVEEVLDHVEETWIGAGGHILQPVWDYMVSVTTLWLVLLLRRYAASCRWYGA